MTPTCIQCGADIPILTTILPILSRDESRDLLQRDNYCLECLHALSEVDPDNRDVILSLAYYADLEYLIGERQKSIDKLQKLPEQRDQAIKAMLLDYYANASEQERLQFMKNLDENRKAVLVEYYNNAPKSEQLQFAKLLEKELEDTKKALEKQREDSP